MIRICLSAAAVLACVSLSIAQEKSELRYDGKPFAYWQTYMRTELKAEKRVDALRALAAFGVRGHAKEATEAIVEMLKDYDNDAEALEVFGAQMPTPDQKVILEAAQALRKFGPNASVAVLAQLDHQAVRVIADKMYLKWVTGISEDAVPVLVRAICSKQADARDLAISVFGETLRDTAADDPWAVSFIRAVEREKATVKVVAALGDALRAGDYYTINPLWLLGEQARPALPALIRAEAIWPGGKVGAILAKLKPTPAERVRVVTALFKEPGNNRIAEAATALSEIGPEARTALPLLLAAIKEPKSESLEHQMAILNAYVKLAGEKESLPTITELLQENRSLLLEPELAEVFLRLEKDAKRVVPVAVKVLERRLAAGKIKPQDKFERRGPVIGSRNGATFYKVYTEEFSADKMITALGDCGESAVGAVPTLLKTYAIAGDDRKLAVVKTLAKIGPAAKDALPVLGKALQSPNEDLRRAAAQAIEAITKK